MQARAQACFTRSMSASVAYLIIATVAKNISRGSLQFSTSNNCHTPRPRVAGNKNRSPFLMWGVTHPQTLCVSGFFPSPNHSTLWPQHRRWKLYIRPSFITGFFLFSQLNITGTPNKASFQGHKPYVLIIPKFFHFVKDFL